ncbi:MAG: aldo/keto reductase [Novosphingobium sp.]|nr:aldo/keto reductase [Novosphingobium sp.]MCP5401048.1 aldo/keto reductase [Novosphingobium sp.]
MKPRRLGNEGLEVSSLGFGCMNLSLGAGLELSESERLAMLDRAVELGITLFDTAEMYGPFTNEVLVGKGLGRWRDKVVISTKFGFDIRGNETRPNGVNSRPDHIRAVCEASLMRLGVDTIDLFYQHRVDPAVPIEDVAGAVGELVAAGKVRFFGLSEAGAETIRRAHSVHPVSALQTEYSLFSRDPENSVLPVCRELGIGFVAYSPLGRGFLAGAGKHLSEEDFRRNLPRWQGEALGRNLGLYEQLESLAEAKGCTPAQISLAWLLHQGEDIVPIPGTTKLHRLAENVAATEIRLDVQDIASIEKAMPASAVAGERYDSAGASLIEP